MNKLYVFAAAFGLIITTAAVSLTASAATTSTSAQPPRFQNHQAMVQAIDGGNYDAWKSAVQERVTEMRQQADGLEKNITQDTFNKLVQVHQLMKDGKFDEAKKLHSELGLVGFGFGGHGRGMHHGLMPGVGQ